MDAIIGDLLGAATTLAGLMLVFLGGLVGAYQQLDKARRTALAPSYRQRGTWAFIGFLAACVSAASAMLAHAGFSPFFAQVSLGLMLVAFAALIGAAVVVFGILFDRT